jgi:osmoprotectant transport system substrate-binding protein
VTRSRRPGVLLRGPAGACEVCYPQVRNGAITVIPEYNGDLLGVSADPSSTAATTAQADQALRGLAAVQLEILNPAAAQDKDSVAVTRATAARYHLTSMQGETK